MTVDYHCLFSEFNIMRAKRKKNSSFLKKMHKVQLLAVNVQTDPQLFLLQISLSINIVVIPDLK